MVNRVGQQLGNYRLVRWLGKGGFAEVYLGEHVYLKTPAAIKVLQMKVVTQEDLEGFLKEAQTIAQLVHPHIVRVLEFGLDEEAPFLVMDYAAGGTLRQRHSKGSQVPLPTIVTYVKQVAEALHYAHTEKLIHRDIKPENILLGRRNELLLSDFGIAIVAQSSRYQSTQEVVGTIAYMSPEQIQGKPRPASDQYSLGVVVYEWLSGKPPFHGSFTELCTQHMFASPPSLHAITTMVPPTVEEVVMTALAKDPKHRFGSVLAFATALEQASQLLVISPPVSPKGNIPPIQHPSAIERGRLSNPSSQPTSADSLSLPIETSAKPNEGSRINDVAIPSGQQAASPESPVSSSFTTATYVTALHSSEAPDQTKRPNRHRLWITLGVIGIVLLAAVGVLLFFYAIRPTPDKTLDTFCNSMQKGDYRGAYSLFTPTFQKTETESQFANENKGASCMHTSASQSGRTATANLSIVSPSGTKSSGQITLVQDSNNNWKINTLPSTPYMTLDGFCNGIQMKDYQAVYNQLSSRVQGQDSESQFASSLAQSGIASCTYGTPVVSGYTATDSITFFSATGQTALYKVTLVKEGNTWKIDNIASS